MRFFIFIIIFIIGCSSDCPAPYKEVTSNYKLPPELQDHKIFILGGQWSNTNPLWIIVPPKGLNQAIIIEKND